MGTPVCSLGGEAGAAGLSVSLGHSVPEAWGLGDFGQNLLWSGQHYPFARQPSPATSSSPAAPRLSQFACGTQCVCLAFI